MFISSSGRALNGSDGVENCSKSEGWVREKGLSPEPLHELRSIEVRPEILYGFAARYLKDVR
jgi:hypothetical protein